jgi:membrane-associated phospholipid phosphatase
MSQRLFFSEEVSCPERLISNMMSPVLLAMPLFGLMLWLQQPMPDYAAGPLVVWGYAFTFYSLLPMLILVGFLRYGKISSLHIPRRQNRHWPFLLGICSYLGGYTMMVYELGFAGLSQAAAFALMLSGLLTAGINLYWKISIHATAVTLSGVFACAAVGRYAALHLPFTVCLSLAAILLVSWARVKLQAHTAGQVGGGILLALLTGGLVLRFYPW